MKRIGLAALLAAVVLAAGGLSGLATPWLLLGTALAGGFGWMLGAMPGGPGRESQGGAGAGETDGGEAGGGEGGGGGGA